MMDVIKECFLYIVFLYLLIMVSYGNRDPAANNMYQALYNEFYHANYQPDNGVAFSQVC